MTHRSTDPSASPASMPAPNPLTVRSLVTLLWPRLSLCSVQLKQVMNEAFHKK